MWGGRGSGSGGQRPSSGGCRTTAYDGRQKSEVGSRSSEDRGYDSGAGLAAIFDPAHSTTGEFGGALDGELFFDVGPVGFDGFDAEVEHFGDLTGALAFADEAEDFEFAVAEAVDGGGPDVGVGLGKVTENFLPDIVADEDFAGEDLPHGPDDVFGDFLLHDVAVGPGAKGAFGVEVFIVHGNDEDGEGSEFGADGLGDVDAVAALEGDVEEDEVGGGFAEEGQEFGAGAGFTADFEVGFLFEEDPDALPDNGMVVHDDNLFFSRCFRHDLSIPLFGIGSYTEPVVKTTPNLGTAPSALAYGEGSVDESGAVAHDIEAHAGGGGAGGGGDADAIVLNGKHEVGSEGLEGEVDAGSLPVFDGIHDAFLGDAVEV